MNVMLRIGLLVLVGMMVVGQIALAEANASEFAGLVFGGINLWGLRDNFADRNIVYRWSAEAQKEIVVWGGPCALEHVSQSALGHVAYIKDLPVSTGLVPRVLEIVFPDLENPHVLCSRKDAYEYAWAPDGKRIAYCQGSGREGWWTGYESSGVFVLDLEGKEMTKVADSGYRPFWAAFDGCLYFEEAVVREKHGVYRYDFGKQEIEKTPYRSTAFSSDGRYYFWAQSEEPAPFELYRRETNSPIGDDSEDGVPTLALRRTYPERWVDECHILASPCAPKYPFFAHYLLNVRTREIRKCEDLVVGLIGEGVALMVRPGGKLEPRRIEDMPVIAADELPKAPYEKSEAPVE